MADAHGEAVGRARHPDKLGTPLRADCRTRTRLAHARASPDISTLTVRTVDSRSSPCSESTSCPASPDESEQSEAIYYRPEARPQASAPSRTRCAPRSSSASTSPPWPCCCASTWGAAMPAAAPQEQPEQPPRGGSVASGPGPERMQPGAVGGSDLAARGACAREVGVDGRYGHFGAIGHVGDSGTM